MSQENIKNIIEAALMVSSKPLSISILMALFEDGQTLQPERNDIRAALEELQQDYEQRGIELVEVASGFRYQARDEYAPWVNHLFDERPPRYSRALLETLAIIAYRQPITRGEIEDIRGVSVSSTIVKPLQERDWIKVVGHRDVPGKPALLATTKSFLDYFNLKKLSDLPDLADIKDFDSINPDLFEALEEETKEQGQEEVVAEDQTEAQREVEQDEDNMTEATLEAEDNDVIDVDTVTAEATAEDNADTTEQSENDSEAEPEPESAQVIPFSN